MSQPPEYEGPGGPPAERLREQLERELGEVPPESPSEPDEQAKPEEAGEEGSESPEAGKGDEEERV